MSQLKRSKIKKLFENKCDEKLKNKSKISTKDCENIKGNA